MILHDTVLYSTRPRDTKAILLPLIQELLSDVWGIREASAAASADPCLESQSRSCLRAARKGRNIDICCVLDT